MQPFERIRANPWASTDTKVLGPKADSIPAVHQPNRIDQIGRCRSLDNHLTVSIGVVLKAVTTVMVAIELNFAFGRIRLHACQLCCRRHI